MSRLLHPWPAGYSAGKEKEKDLRPFSTSPLIFRRCERGDSNPHGFPHWILSPARLPIPPHSQAFHIKHLRQRHFPDWPV